MHPKLVILFGSQAKGMAKKTSDIDIAVLAQGPLSLDDKFALIPRLAKKYDFHEDKIEIIDLMSAPPLLQYEVAKYGKLLEGDQLNFLLFKISAWRQYQDTAKLRRLREKRLKKQIYGE